MSPWPKYYSGAIRQVGGTQLELLRRAAHSPSGQIILAGTTKANNAQWCAMKRMVQRGLFHANTFGSKKLGFMTVYTITGAGRDALRREESR